MSCFKLGTSDALINTCTKSDALLNTCTKSDTLINTCTKSDDCPKSTNSGFVIHMHQKLGWEKIYKIELLDASRIKDLV